MKYSLVKNNNLQLIEDINLYDNEKYRNVIIFETHYKELTKIKDNIDNDEILTAIELLELMRDG